MTPEKSLGEVAFNGLYPEEEWDRQTQACREYCERFASAVAAEVRRRDGAEQKQEPMLIIETPPWQLTKLEQVAAMVMQTLIIKTNGVFRGPDVANTAFDYTDAFFAEAQRRKEKG